MTIRVVAHIIALPEKVEELKAVLLEFIELTIGEKGAIKYELLQNQSDPTDFTFVDEWASNEDLDTHLGSPRIQNLMAKFDGLVAAPPDIRRYHLLG